MPQFHVRAHQRGPVEPQGLDYCRRNGLSCVYEQHKWTCDDVTDELEELLIIDSTVIWTTGKNLRKAFDLSEEGQEVKQALFVHFPNPESLFAQKDDSNNITSDSRGLLPTSRLFALNNAFKSTANVAHLQDTGAIAKSERGLVILLEEILYIYHDDGRRDLVNLPFPVRKVFACKTGIILERLLDLDSFPESFERRIHRIPKFFSLSDPLQHLALISTVEGEKRVLQACDEICYINEQILIMRNAEESRLSVWAFIDNSSVAPMNSKPPPTSTNSIRRRSSMRVSTASLSRLDDFGDDVPRSSTHIDLPLHFDRAPFIALDPSTLFNDSDTLPKEILIEHVGSMPFDNNAEIPRIVQLEDMSLAQSDFLISCAPGQYLVEMSVKRSRSGKLTMTYTRQDLVRNVAKIRTSTGLYPILLDTAGRTSLYCPGSPQISFSHIGPVLDILEHHKNSFLYRVSEDEWHQAHLSFGDSIPLVSQALLCYKTILDPAKYHLFFAIFLDTFYRFEVTSQLDGFIISLFSCFLDPLRPRKLPVDFPSQDLDTTVLRNITMAEQLCQAHDTHLLKQDLGKMLLALHFLMEENSLTILNCAQERVIPTLVQLFTWTSWESYVQYYSALLPIGLEVAIDDPIESLPYVLCPSREPPSLIRWIASMLQGQKESLLTIECLIPNTGTAAAPKSQKHYKAVSLCPISHAVQRIFHALIDTKSTLPMVLEVMMSTGMSKFILNQLPRALVIPIQDVITSCALHPSSSWGAGALSYIGREDLVHFLTHKKLSEHHLDKAMSTNLDTSPSIPVTLDATSSNVPEARKLASDVVGLIFDQDRRVQEVLKMLTCHAPTSVQWNPPEQLGEAEQIRQQQKLSRLVANRTLAIPIGRAMLCFSSFCPVPTEKFPIMKMNFDVKIKPIQVTISEDKSSQIPDLIAWPNFHNGVASGLSISRSAREISASWIAYNRPEELSDDHAGFLLGLGLNGHLKAMTTWHAFNYLTSKHSMTSIGLLLGLSASFLGSMDPMVAKLLTVHILALLPPGSSELNLSGATQAAGVVGVGLLYFGSTDRKLSGVLLNEILNTDNSVERFRDEGYRLAAGIALGMINIGKGNVKTGILDSTLTPRLLTGVRGTDREKHDLDVKMPGSIIALGLMYLRTNNKYIADRLRAPATCHEQNYIRPDLYLLRVLAIGLVMWNDIQASTNYVRSQLPACMSKFADLSSMNGQTMEELIPLNIVAGACMAIGFKHAGSLASGPRDFLLEYLDKMIKVFGTEDHGLVHKSLRLAIRTHLGILSLAVAMVMAGSGDLQVLRRLRRLHYRLDQEAWYGNYMAIEMALGLLFLNEGQSSLDTSDLAIATFVAAFYPVLPNLPKDNQSHLQALRHLWALGTEARCLIPRDSATKKACILPITIQFKDSTRGVLRNTAPCILPPIEVINSISVNSDEYWPLQLDLGNSKSHLQALIRDQTIYVIRRGNGPSLDNKPRLLLVDSFTDVDENNPVMKDILAKFSRHSEERQKLSREILTTIEPWSWNNSVSQTLLLSSVQQHREPRLPELTQLLFAYWNAISSGILSHKYPDTKDLCLNEQFVQRLKLRLWQKQHESS